MNKLIVVAVACMACLPAYGREASIDVETLAQICQGAEGGVRDITVEYDYGVANPGSEKEMQAVAAEGGGMIRGMRHVKFCAAKPFTEAWKATISYDVEDMDGSKYVQTEIRSHVGGQMRVYSQQEGGRKGRSGAISMSSKSVRPTGFYPLDFTAFYREEGRTIGDVLKSAAGLKQCIVKLNRETKVVNDCNSVSAELWLRLADGKEILTRRYTFSVDHAYAIVKIEVTNGKDVVCTMDVLKLIRVDNGTWFPSECRASSPDGLVNTITVTRVAVNQGVVSKDLELAFPASTRVEDAINGRSYTTQPTQGQVDKALP